MLKNWTDRVGYRMVSRGSHFIEIIFIINRKDCTYKYKKFKKIFIVFQIKSILALADLVFPYKRCDQKVAIIFKFRELCMYIRFSHFGLTDIKII